MAGLSMLVEVIQGNPIQIVVETIGGKCGRGASISACADLTNQLLSCWVNPRIAWKKTLASCVPAILLN